jgi:MoaA/NifB/PqqE/SkfB family radical SAM enzyme
MNKDTFCILPFIHLYSNSHGVVSPCCISQRFDSKINLKNSSIEDAFNTPQFKKLRKDLISGTKSKICNRCWEIESKGLSSYRTDSNSQFGFEYEMEDNGYVNPNFQYIDIRFSNICNLKCIMCMHDYSSQHWNKELEEKGIPKVLKIKDNIVDELKPYLSNLKKIYFAGGEPLITNEHYQLLDYLYENNKNIHIEYTTNLSILKKDFESLIKKWKEFKLVHVQVSLDGLFEKGESIRVGINTKSVLKNILILQKNNLSYSISFSVANYNVMDILEFSKYLIENNIVTNEQHLEFNNYVLTPRKYSIQNLSNKKEVLLYLNNVIDFFKTERLKQQMLDIKSIIEKNLI